MKRGRSFLSVLLSLGILIGSTAIAEEASKNPASSNKPMVPSRKSKMTNIKGEVAQVDQDAKTIKIKEGSKEYTVSLTEKTVVTGGKIKKSISDIKAGDRVVARISEEDGKMTARSIRLAQEEKKGKKGTTPAVKVPAP